VRAGGPRRTIKIKKTIKIKREEDEHPASLTTTLTKFRV
jgi:hypothetical protein